MERLFTPRGCALFFGLLTLVFMCLGGYTLAEDIPHASWALLFLSALSGLAGLVTIATMDIDM
jgi:hypothetical protein